MNIAIITGASSGIGRELFVQLNKTKNKLSARLQIDQYWLIARSKEKLEETASLVPEADCRIFPLDLADPAAAATIIAELQGNAEYNPRLLVNNAGFGLVGEPLKLDRKKQLGMLDLNIRALTDLTLRIAPLMPKESLIVQLASLVSFVPVPQMAVYSASKSYVLDFSIAMDRIWRSRGICVTAVCPGPVSTGFTAVATGGNQKAMRGSKPVDKTVKRIIKLLGKNKRVVIPALSWRFAALVSRLISKKSAARLAAKAKF